MKREAQSNRLQNYIKRQAKEHDGFRRFAVKRAQRVHQLDMRMRLGILHDAEAQQRMHERERKAAEDKKRKAEAPTVRSEEEQRKHDDQQAKAEKEGSKKKEDKHPKVKIPPLSDAKAIELGANFFSEAFIFGVAAGLLVWDSWRSRRKESARRDDVAERLEGLETELVRLRSKYEPGMAVTEKVKPEQMTSWYNPAGWWTRTEPEPISEAAVGTESAAPAVKPIPGNVPVVDPAKAVKPTQGARTTPDPIDSGSRGKPASEPPTESERPAVAQVRERVDSVSASKRER